jgi:hypothetical protein
MKKNTMVWRLAAVALSCVLAFSACGGPKGGGSKGGAQEESAAPAADPAADLLAALEGGDAAVMAEALGGLTPAVLSSLAAASGSPGGDFAYDLNGAKDGIVINRYTGNGGVVIIPPTIEDYPVTEIGDEAFKEDYGITAVVVPATVKKIGGEFGMVFIRCKNLTTVILPDTLEEIGSGTFEYCFSLHTVNIPAGIKKIGMEAFYQCGELYNLSIPDSITAIEWEAPYGWSHFEGCGKLKLATRERLKNLGYKGEF